MRKDIKLNSSYWIDLIFEGKNKKYGAYYLRRTSWKRHLIALLAIVILTAVVAILPSFIEAVKKDKKEDLGGIEQAVELENLEDEVLEEDIINQEAVIPPPPLMETIQFTPPVFVDAADLDEDQEILTVEELSDSRVRISVANIDGVDDPDAVDISTIIEKKQIMAEKKEEVLMTAQQMPIFPGGDAAMRKWIGEHINYPQIALENNVQGRVNMSFVVSKDGTISNIQVIASPDPSLEEEAIRIIKAMPKWIPGRQNGVAVVVRCTIPVTFRLEMR